MEGAVEACNCCSQCEWHLKVAFIVTGLADCVRSRVLADDLERCVLGKRQLVFVMI